MGGYGSSRWHGHSKKTAVEDCLVLPTEPIKKSLANGPGRSGTVTWSRNDERFAWIGYSTEPAEDGLAVRLSYCKTIGELKTPVDYSIRVISVPVHLGGSRWFFLCPLIVAGKPCLRKAAKLYLPPGALYFACRTCYGLTYTSAQEAHKFDGLYALLAARLGRGCTARDVREALKQ